jgi:hypothetical protein
MSRCLGARVADLADGRLEPADAERAFAHVAACAECRGELDAQRAATSRLTSSSSIEPPSDLFQRLLSVPTTEPAQSATSPAVPPQGTAGQRPAGPAGVRPSPGARSTRPSSRSRRGRVVLASAAGAAALAVVAVVGGGSALSGVVVPRPAIAPVVDTLTDEHAASADQMPFSGPRIVTVGFTDRAATASPSAQP